MAYVGFIVRDRVTGNVILGPDDRICRIIGERLIVNTGSMVVPEFGKQGAKPWVYLFDTAYQSPVPFIPIPEVTITATGISWLNNSGGTGSTRTVRMIYGVY